MVILRMKSFPKKLKKTGDKIDKEVLDYLNKKEISKLSYKEYKYVYTWVVLFEIFKKFHPEVRKQDKLNFLEFGRITGKYENKVEEGIINPKF